MTRDVSDLYDRWAGGGDAGAFGPTRHSAVTTSWSAPAESTRGGWNFTRRSSASSPRRAATTTTLTIVLAQARSGVLCLSLQALEGTGITGVRAGRNRLRRTQERAR